MPNFEAEKDRSMFPAQAAGRAPLAAGAGIAASASLGAAPARASSAVEPARRQDLGGERPGRLVVRII